MAKSVDPVLLALIATLDERAKKKGDKSIVKSIVVRLTEAGANKELIGEISALRPAKPAKAKPVMETKAASKANGKAKADAPEPADAAPTAVGG